MHPVAARAQRRPPLWAPHTTKGRDRRASRCDSDMPQRTANGEDRDLLHTPERYVERASRPAGLPLWQGISPTAPTALRPSHQQDNLRDARAHAVVRYGNLAPSLRARARRQGRGIAQNTPRARRSERAGGNSAAGHRKTRPQVHGFMHTAQAEVPRRGVFPGSGRPWSRQSQSNRLCACCTAFLIFERRWVSNCTWWIPRESTRRRPTVRARGFKGEGRRKNCSAGALRSAGAATGCTS